MSHSKLESVLQFVSTSQDTGATVGSVVVGATGAGVGAADVGEAVSSSMHSTGRQSRGTEGSSMTSSWLGSTALYGLSQPHL
jgi:hypothetical protein